MLATAYNLTALLSLCCDTLTLSQHLAVIVRNITVAAHQEQRHIHTIIYISQKDTVGLSEVQTDILLARLHKHKPWPVLKYNAAPPIRRFWDNFNNNYIIVAKLEGQSQYDEHLLTVLWQRAWQNTQSRLILLLDDVINEIYIADILQYCAAHQAMNVIAMRPTEATQKQSYWTLKLFPKLVIVRRQFSPHYKATFPQHLGNMHAHPLSIATTVHYPECYFMPGANGTPILSGLSGKIFVEYARRHNATLLYPFREAKDAVFLDRLDDVVQNGSADMSCLQSYENPNRNLSYSRMYDRRYWCLMVPIEPPLAPATFFFIIFDGVTIILIIFGMLILSLALTLTFCLQGSAISYVDLVFNAPVLQGLLGQTFWMESRTLAARSAIYVGISVAGIIFNTTYGTYLQSFNMRAPTSAPVENIPDLIARGTKILIHADEMKLLHLNVAQFMGIRPYLSYMTVFENISEISQLRSAFDTRYAYFVSMVWPIIEEQQKFFKRPIFRLSNICIVSSYPLVLSFSENSVHRWALNALLGDLKAAGLLEFWKRHAFVEMLQLKQITLKDRNRKSDFEPMNLEALSIVLSALAMLEIMAAMCFLIELCWAKRRRIFKFQNF